MILKITLRFPPLSGLGIILYKCYAIPVWAIMQAVLLFFATTGSLSHLENTYGEHRALSELYASRNLSYINRKRCFAPGNPKQGNRHDCGSTIPSSFH